MAEPTPRSPEWWVRKLNRRLDERRPMLDRWNAYYEGNHPLPRGPEWAKDAFRRWLKLSRSNWMGLVVDAVAERLAVQGIRYPDPDAADGGLEADKAAWRLWQANGLDVGAGQVHLEALINGVTYVTVAPNPDDPDTPLMMPEHPTQMIVACSPANRRVREAAFKKWLDDSGHLHGTLYLPEEVYKLQSEVAWRDGMRSDDVRWVPRYSEGDEWLVDNPYGVVTVVPFRNRARLLGDGRSEIDGVTDSQDRINDTLFGRVVAGKAGAFRQRFVTGFTPEMDEATGLPKKPFEPGQTEVWYTSDPNARFGDFDQTDLSGYLSAIEADVQHIAAQTHTPPHYLLGEMVNLAAEALKAVEAGLISKVRDRATGFGESWEEAWRLAFLIADDPKRAQVPDAEVIWRNPEFRTEGQLVDALVKLKTINVADEILWERYGLSPPEIERNKKLLAAQALTGAGSQLDALLRDEGTPPLPPPGGNGSVPVGVNGG